MDKEAFEEWIKRNHSFDICGYEIFTADYVRELYALLVPHWVPVGERLPEDGRERRLAIKFDEDPFGKLLEATGFYCVEYEDWFVYDDCGNKLTVEVTHWLDHYIPPLPEVPDAS